METFWGNEHRHCFTEKDVFFSDYKVENASRYLNCSFVLISFHFACFPENIFSRMNVLNFVALSFCRSVGGRDIIYCMPNQYIKIPCTMFDLALSSSQSLSSQMRRQKRLIKD